MGFCVYRRSYLLWSPVIVKKHLPCFRSWVNIYVISCCFVVGGVVVAVYFCNVFSPYCVEKTAATPVAPRVLSTSRNMYVCMPCVVTPLFFAFLFCVFFLVLVPLLTLLEPQSRFGDKLLEY